MYSDMAGIEQITNNKPQYGGKMDPVLYGIIERLRVDEDRSFSNMIERLLKTHPRIQEILEPETDMHKKTTDKSKIPQPDVAVSAPLN